ncbi:MAG TPA: pyroglutamyl-peptidase I [Tissierellia bacterium]|nr:pyroglutamyl-peptidase I [Tissierellia bacterium]
MKILVTGFDPFDQEEINPSYEVVKGLPDQINGHEILKVEIPTAFKKSAEVIEQVIRRLRPDVVLCIGQASGRAAISLEKVAINLAEARIADNEGHQPCDEPLREDGPAAYFSNLPIKRMVEEIRRTDIPAEISYTAGTYVCNSLMYHVLYLADRRFPGLKGGFIHVPDLPHNGKSNKLTPSMSLEDMVSGISVAIESIDFPESCANFGTII